MSRARRLRKAYDAAAPGSARRGRLEREITMLYVRRANQCSIIALVGVVAALLVVVFS